MSRTKVVSPYGDALRNKPKIDLAKFAAANKKVSRQKNIDEKKHAAHLQTIRRSPEAVRG